jgi:hypothetical protein
VSCRRLRRRPAERVGGSQSLSRLPSDQRASLELGPDAECQRSDGTHIDFFAPRGKWKIKIYTVSGDLVAELPPGFGERIAAQPDRYPNGQTFPDTTGSRTRRMTDRRAGISSRVTGRTS